MIELTCCGCKWKGRVRDRLAGLRVICKRCRAVSRVPDAVTREVYLGDWLSPCENSWKGPRASSPTAEMPAYPLPLDSAPTSF
jgi:hypothetical protein